MNRIALLGMGILLAGSALGACSSDNGNGTGAGGSTGAAGSAGGSTGAAGSAGGSTGAAGSPALPFMAVNPCPTEGDYTTGTTTIEFGVNGITYEPKCLKVPHGTTVTFSGDFPGHPLRKSTMRGDTANNPIVNTSTGDSTTVSFPTPGFYAYYCVFHGVDSSGSNMAGVVWVE